MKKLLLLLVVFAVATACQKNEVEDLSSSLNVHYGLKDYMMVVDLMAGQHIPVGTVTYLDTEDGYFKITFELVDGWTMSESHVYAGSFDDMPRNKPGMPKIGQFPYSSVHNPEVTTYTYTHEVDTWDKFCCAAHAVVNHPNYPSETAWASGNMPFREKGGSWSTYTDNFSTAAVQVNVIYGIEQNTDGSLNLVYINTTSPVPEVIISETVNAGGGPISAAAFDPVANKLFFVIGNTLYVNDLNSDDPSFVIGTLPGTPGGGAFLNGNFYYIDLDPNSSNYNEIIEVQLSYDANTGSWTMTINDDYSSSLPYDYYTITDMAANGNEIYLVGNNNNNNGNVDLISYDINTGQYNVITTQLNGDAQITFGPDGNMYAVDSDGSGNSQLVSLDTNSGDTDDIDMSDGATLGDMSDLTISEI